MSEYAQEATAQESDQGMGWGLTRVILHVGAAILAAILFVVLVFQILGDGSTGLIWTLAVAMIVIVVAQLVTLFIKPKETYDEVESWSEEEVAEDDWETAETDEQTTEAWDAEDTAQVADDDVYTVGCPACGTAFTITSEMAKQGDIHCVNCGVGGEISDDELDPESVHDVTCNTCSDTYRAYNTTSTCPHCDAVNEELVA